jgi:hypothetical protein
MTASGALSPLRGPILVIRVYRRPGAAKLRADLGEQGVHHTPVGHHGEHLAARVQVTPLGEGDQALRERREPLGLGLGGGDRPCSNSAVARFARMSR